MSDPFLVGVSRKRKKTQAIRSSKNINKNQTSKNIRRNHVQDSEQISEHESEIDDEKVNGNHSFESDEDVTADETPAEKRLRLAKEYLEKLEDDLKNEDGFDAEEIDREIIAERLKFDAMELSGKFHKQVAQFIDEAHPVKSLKKFKNHRQPLTDIAISPKNDLVCAVSKDSKILIYSLSGRLLHAIESLSKGKERQPSGHKDSILCVAISPNGEYIVTGGKDKRIIVWSVKDYQFVKCFSQHRGPVISLCFRQRSNQLYSGSTDRTIKVWDLEQLTYIETLFGHQDSIANIDAMVREQCVSAGSRDRTCRLWKITEETHMVYRGGGMAKERDFRTIKSLALDSQTENMELEDQHKIARSFFEGSIDCVAMIDEEHWISGGDNGSISLWSASRKKPVFVFPLSHGMETVSTPEQFTAENVDKLESTIPSPPARPRWVTSLATLRYADVFASGSWNGSIRLWRLKPDLRSFEPLGVIKNVIGFVNALKFVQESQISKQEGSQKLKLIAVTSREPRLGRWHVERNAKNSGLLIVIKTKQDKAH